MGYEIALYCDKRETFIAKLRVLVEPFLGPMVNDTVLETLSWMVEEKNHRRKDTGLEEDPLSPAMQAALALLEDLQTRRIECRRVP